MIENIIICIVFLGALTYIFSMVRKQFSAKTAGCASCSGNCKVTNFDLIELPEVKGK